MAVRLCPTCGKPVRIGEKCHRCDKSRCKRPNHGTKTAEQERQRERSETWRREYRSAEYQANRQAVMARQSGRCASCGLPVAQYRSGKWYTGSYGGIHHIKKLSEGGSHGIDNLVLLCVQCHNRIDAEGRAR